MSGLPLRCPRCDDLLPDFDAAAPTLEFSPVDLRDCRVIDVVITFLLVCSCGMGVKLSKSIRGHAEEPASEDERVSKVLQ